MRSDSTSWAWVSRSSDSARPSSALIAVSSAVRNRTLPSSCSLAPRTWA